MKEEKNFLSESEHLESLFPDMSEAQLANISSGMTAMPEDLVNAMLDQSKKLIGGMVDYKELMMMYTCAMKTIKTKFDVLNAEFKVRYQRNPIKLIDSRLKSTASVMDKLESRGIPFSLGNIETHINDVAGVRVICSYLDDIYLIAKALTEQKDITLIEQKDYIENPKPNGYRSMHLIVGIPVYFAQQVKYLKVEVQIRTIAMDFWASLEHQLRYKQPSPDESIIVNELKDCADIISDTDLRMLKIRKKIEASTGKPTEDEVLLEKLRKIDMSIE